MILANMLYKASIIFTSWGYSMTITIEKARELLPPEYGEISDEEIQHILNYMYFVIDFAYNKQMKQLWEGKDKLDSKM